MTEPTINHELTRARAEQELASERDECLTAVQLYPSLSAVQRRELMDHAAALGRMIDLLKEQK